MINVIKAARSAERILVPKGDDNQACIREFEQATDIEVPDFPDKRYIATSEGRTFFLVKGKDIPGFVSADNFNANVGITGFDSYLEFAGSDRTNLSYQKLGQPMCRFSLLAPKDQATELLWTLERRQSSVTVATSFPQMLQGLAAFRRLKLSPLKNSISGSTELMPQLCNAQLVADLVSTGNTANINGLVAVKDMLDIYPAILVKNGPEPKVADDQTYQGVANIDATLIERLEQAQDLRRTSYVTEQMRDPNKRRKKIGEEAAELITASCIGSPDDTLGELADLLFAGTVDLVVKSDGKFGLGSVIDLLIDRNVEMTTVKAQDVGNKQFLYMNPQQEKACQDLRSMKGYTY